MICGACEGKRCSLIPWRNVSSERRPDRASVFLFRDGSLRQRSEIKKLVLCSTGAAAYFGRKGGRGGSDPARAAPRVGNTNGTQRLFRVRRAQRRRRRWQIRHAVPPEAIWRRPRWNSTPEKIRTGGTRRRADGYRRMGLESDSLELLAAATCSRDNANLSARRIEPSEPVRFSDAAGRTRGSWQNDIELQATSCR